MRLLAEKINSFQDFFPPKTTPIKLEDFGGRRLLARKLSKRSSSFSLFLFFMMLKHLYRLIFHIIKLYVYYIILDTSLYYNFEL
jgi:hypothetical protein